MIIANGCQKSGTHALTTWLEDLGHQRYLATAKVYPKARDKVSFMVDDGTGRTRPHQVADLQPPSNRYFMHGHVPADCSDQLAGFRVITIMRDPRDVWISYWRECTQRRAGKKPFGDLTWQQCLQNFYGWEFVPWYRRFLGWCGKCTVIEYKDMVASPKGKTYTGAPTDWEDWWDAEKERLWCDAGGYELVIEAGYDP